MKMSSMRIGTRQASCGFQSACRARVAAVNGGRLRRRPRLQQTQAAVDPAVSAAVSQQAVAFAVVLAAEAAYTRSYVPDGDKGRPEIPAVAAGAGSTVAAVALLGVGGSGPLASIGLVAGLVSSGAMIYYNALRASRLEFKDADWPGPKAWPVGMALISFFAFCAFLQALVSAVNTVAL